MIVEILKEQDEEDLMSHDSPMDQFMQQTLNWEDMPAESNISTADSLQGPSTAVVDDLLQHTTPPSNTMSTQDPLLDTSFTEQQVSLDSVVETSSASQYVDPLIELQRATDIATSISPKTD